MPCRTGLFEGVDAKVKPMKKGMSQVRFIFKEKVWPEMQSFKVSPSGQPPPHMHLLLTPTCMQLCTTYAEPQHVCLWLRGAHITVSLMSKKPTVVTHYAVLCPL